MAKKIGLYPGSFDPFTNGHLYMLRQAAELFDEIIVVIAVNSTKKRRIDAEKMAEAIREVIAGEAGLAGRVQVEIYEGIVVRLAEERGAKFLIRGLRDGVDYKYEENLAEINHYLTQIETVYFRAGEQSYVSSSMVMELFGLGESVAGLVPVAVSEVLKAA